MRPFDRTESARPRQPSGQAGEGSGRAVNADSRTADWIRNDDGEQSTASFPELFFDLVFVFALIQLSHALASSFSSTAMFEACLLYTSPSPRD